MSAPLWTTVKDLCVHRDLYERWWADEKTHLTITSEGFEQHLLTQYPKDAECMARIRFVSSQGQRFGIWWRLFCGPGSPFPIELGEFVAQLEARLDKDGKFIWDHLDVPIHDLEGTLEQLKVEHPREGLHFGDDKIRIGFDVGIPALQNLANSSLYAFEARMRAKMEEVVQDVWNPEISKQILEELNKATVPKVGPEAAKDPQTFESTIEALKNDPHVVSDAYERIIATYKEIRGQAIDEMHFEFSQDKENYKVSREELAHVSMLYLPLSSFLSDAVYEVVIEGTRGGNEALEQEIKISEALVLDAEIKYKEAVEHSHKTRMEEFVVKCAEVEKKLKEQREKIKERHEFRQKLELERGKERARQKTKKEDIHKIMKI